jgi:S1-C subfamily serine protease
MRTDPNLRLSRARLAVLAMLAALTAPVGASVLGEFEAEVARLVETVTPKVVTVQALFPEASSQSGPGGVVNVGTGLVADSLGHIVTSSSVVRHSGRLASIISVVDHEYRTHEAIIFSIDPVMGVAMLLAPTLQVRSALRVRGQEWQIGRFAIIVGNSAGVMPTAALTTVAGRREQDQFWQLAQPVTPGCSGAPVFDSDGLFGGLIVGEMATLGGGRTERALPAVMVSSSAIRSILARFAGTVVPNQRPYLGFSASPGLRADGRMAITVSEVIGGSPASRAGLEPGDVLITVDSMRMAYLADLSDWLRHSTPGHVAKVNVLRHGRPRAFTVTVGRR